MTVSPQEVAIRTPLLIARIAVKSD